jgi:ribosomal protein S7
MSNKNLYLKLIGFLTKKGNKSKALKIVNSAFLNVSDKTGLSFSEISLKLFDSLNCFVEVKKVKIKRGSHFVPFLVSPKRRSYLIVKWLVQASLEDKSNLSFSEKLSSEIQKTVVGNSSRSLKTKAFNLNQALSNRSTIHYRW